MQSNPLASISLRQLKQAVAIREKIEGLENELSRVIDGQSSRARSAAPPRKGTMSRAARAKISAAMKARWAKRKGRGRISSNTLKAAKAQGDVLVVVVAKTSTAIKLKKDRKIYHDEKLRRELVSSLSFVDLAVIGKEGTLYDTVEYVKPDIIALGYDQAHSEKDISENCQKRNLRLRVIRLNTPIPGTKSSHIKNELGDSFYGI